MRSFTFALVAAAFATLISAAPVTPGLLGPPSLSNTVDVVGTAKGLLKGKTNGLPGGVRARVVPDLSPPVDVVGTAKGLLKGKTNGLPGGVQARVVPDLSLPKLPKLPETKLPELGTRGDTPCLDFIINEVSTGVHPSVEKLQSVSSFDVITIKGIVVVIKGYIDAAIPRVKALVGDEKDAILVSVDGQVVTVKHIANLLAGILKPILVAVGCLLKFVDDDVKAILADLITDVFVLVGGVVRLVDGLADALGPLITDVGDVIVALGVDISQYGLNC